MTRRALVGWLIGALVIAGIIVGSWWPVHQKVVQARAAVSLKAAWEDRSLTLYPNGCVELRTDGGRRAFVYVGKAWRECPKGRGR